MYVKGKISTEAASWHPWHMGTHSRPQRPRSFWSAPRIATSGRVQQRKSAIHGLPVTLRMLRVKSDKSDWFWSQSIVFTNPFKTGMSLDLARSRDSWCWPKGARPLGTRMMRTKPGSRMPPAYPARPGTPLHMWCWWCFIQLILKFIFDFKFLGFSSIFSIFLLVFFL